MKKILLLLFFALAAYGQQTSVAVLPSESTKLGNDELEALTDEMRGAALKILPPNAFLLLKQDVVIKRLGGAENYIKECKESSCIVDLGKKAQVDYVAQANVGKLGSKFRLKVELYNVRSGGLVGMLNDEAKDIKGLLDIVKKNVSAEVFGKISGTSSDSKATLLTKNNSETSGKISSSSSKVAQQSKNNFLERGILFVNRGDYEIAIEDFTEALKLQPDNDAIYMQRGNAHIKKGDYDKAIADFSQAIRLDPNNIEAYSARGDAYFIKDDDDKAFADFNQIIKLNHNYVEAYIKRGNVYIKKGNYDKAISDFSQIIKLNPNDVDAYVDLGIVYYMKHYDDKAIAVFSKAIKLEPNKASAYRLRGYVYSDRGDYKEAIADLSKAIMLDPNDDEAREELESIRKATR